LLVYIFLHKSRNLKKNLTAEDIHKSVVEFSSMKCSTFLFFRWFSVRSGRATKRRVISYARNNHLLSLFVSPRGHTLGLPCWRVYVGGDYYDVSKGCLAILERLRVRNQRSSKTSSHQEILAMMLTKIRYLVPCNYFNSIVLSSCINYM